MENKGLFSYRTDYIGVLDGIRVIAILIVLWFHYWQQTWLMPYYPVPHLKQWFYIHIQDYITYITNMTTIMLFPLLKMVPPRFELGSREPESHMLPLHHGTFLSYLYSFPFTMPSYPWPLTPSFLSPYALFPFPILSLLSLLSSYSLFFLTHPFLLPLSFSFPPYLTSSLFSLLFLFSKKRLPWVSNPRPYG